MATETEWRRRWKPTLAACPWQSVDVDGETLLIKMKFTDNSYEVLVTDLTSFWHESLDENPLKKRIEKLNPSIEAPITKILDQIKQNVDTPSKGTRLSVKFKDMEGGTAEDQQKMLLSITSTLAGMPFVWSFHAVPADSSMARDHLTIPLLSMVSELFRRQRELTAILAGKDKEIDDYKSQGVRTSRKNMETTKFDAIAFKNSMTTSKGFENQVRNLQTATFDGEGQELYRQIVTKHAWLTHKNSGGDGDDEAMSDDESIPMSGQGTASTKQSWASRLPPSLVPSKISPTKTPPVSPSKSPGKSPAKSPASNSSSSETTPAKDTEKMRREALERKLEQEEQKKQEKKKKKKLAF